MFRILLVEDDEKIRNILKSSFRQWGYEVHAPDVFDQIDKVFTDYNPHLVILDINLPVFDGYYWCRLIRSKSKVPVLFLSSRQENLDMITAINMGGDDYIQKPFDLELLIVKVQALLRRTYSYQDETELVLSHSSVSLQLDNSTLEYQGQVIELTRNEFLIMKCLMKQPGKIVSREDLMQALWNDDQFVDDNTLTVNVNRLRRKLAGVGVEEFISTRKGMGYIIQ